MLNGQRDVLVRDFVKPIKILACDNCTNSEVLIKNEMRQATLPSINVCTIQEGGFVLLDFGVEFHGGANITIQQTIFDESEKRNVCDELGKIRVVFGESVSEALSEIGFKNATNNHSPRDITLNVSSRSNIDVGKTGFRFLKIEAVKGIIEIAAVNGIFIHKDIEFKGEFLCNDDKLNKIWQIGAYTVFLNMQEYLWDGIKRDRLVWIGDMHPEISVISTVFGFDECVPNSLDFIKNETKIGEFMNGLPTYSMWWIKIQLDWYMQNGNYNYLKQNRDYIFETLKSFFPLINDDGTPNVPDNFVDWPSRGKDQMANCGVWSMLIIAMQSGIKLCNFLNNNALANECYEKIQILKRHTPNHQGYKQIAALYALATGKEDEVNQNTLSVNPISGLSTFLGYYTLKSRGNAGDVSGALNVIRDYWGNMIDFGATTFWEDFDIEWTKNAYRIDEIPVQGKNDIHGDNGAFCYKGFRHSLCHGWAGGPTAFLSEYVLGIKILEPGCKKIKILPNLGDLQWANGKYPTPYGMIEVEHKKVNGKIETKLKVPEEITVE